MNETDFISVSLKLKKPEVLLKELKKYEITLVIDCRRRKSRTAPYFSFNNLEKLLKYENNFDYHTNENFANTFYRKTKEEFFESRHLLLTPTYKNQLRSHKKIGLLCYCKEEEMIKGNCHTVWVGDNLSEQLSFNS